MKSNEYQKQALSVECEYTDEARQRLVDNAKWLAVHLQVIKVEAEKLDKLKKFVYYNRQNGLQAVNEPFTSKEMNDRLRKQARLLHHVIGAITETAELADTVLNHILNGTELDTVNIMEEFGDISWYTAGGVDEAGYTLEEMQERNIVKLTKIRYGNGFSEEAANNRDLETERKILEDVKKDANS